MDIIRRGMSPKAMRMSLFLVAMLGLIVSSRLLIAYTSSDPYVCSIDGGCDKVRLSEYASFFGVSTPVYGLVYYGLLALGVIALAVRPGDWWVKWGMILLTGVGLAVSVWLTYLEAFVILAWCYWCLASAILTLVAFALVWGNMGKDYE